MKNKKTAFLICAVCLCLSVSAVFVGAAYTGENDSREVFSKTEVGAEKAVAQNAEGEHSVVLDEPIAVEDALLPEAAANDVIIGEELILSPKVSKELTEMIKNSEADALIKVAVRLCPFDEAEIEQAILAATGISPYDAESLASEQLEQYMTAKKQVQVSMHTAQNESVVLSLFGASSLDEVDSERIGYLSRYTSLSFLYLTPSEIARLGMFKEVLSVDVCEDLGLPVNFDEP